jgi:malate synthase
MSINAMNALHRALPNESPLIAELVQESGQVPRWGADNEDSKTPIMRSFLHACRNLIGCFEGNLSYDDPKNGKSYRLTQEGLALPIKRIPGLALPDGSHIYKNNPLPLHLFDFAMHMFHNWNRPQSLIFYIPKLENEEEAAYIHFLIEEAESLLSTLHPSYKKGSVGLFIVFENPRAIFRIQEMADELYPYFVGGSLGWHDFLASTARLFKHDPNYRIPVKADPNIVINHIKESHLILKNALASIGAISIGGMYGTLYEEGNPKSFEICMVGYIKDVVTQLKRGLDGFWVAHPNFVRIGIALVYAWRCWDKNHSDARLKQLISNLVPNPIEQLPLIEFVFGEDVDGLTPDDPLYARGVLAADIAESELISNSDEKELRYNIFQALQYIADWLCGNGCVALPAQLTNASGEQIFVRIMDDLATTERSRWELWAEVHHKRVSIDRFRELLHDESSFIRADQERPDKRIQVRWTGLAATWYPTAISMLDTLVTSPEPVEFVSQLLMRELYSPLTQ